MRLEGAENGTNEFIRGTELEQRSQKRPTKRGIQYLLALAFWLLWTNYTFQRCELHDQLGLNESIV